ncbi:MAG: hypothetical protein WB797_10310 [Nocardioides sp.]
MNSDVVGRLVGLLASGLVLALLYYLQFGRRAPDKVREAGNKWAWKRQAYVDGRWTEQLNKQLRAQRLADLLGMFALCIVVVQVPVTMRAYAACLALVPALLATLRGLSLLRGVTLPPGTRVARLRELSLSDYLPSRLRLAMWGAAAIGAAATVRLAVQQGQPWAIASAALLLMGPAAVEVSGARLARQPEPAVDAAHLYWQDALRSDLLRSTAEMATAAGVFLSLLTPAIIGFEHLADTVVWYALALGLGLFILIGDQESHERPANYMRSRLWPTLGPDHVLRSGDPLPDARTAA